MLRWMGVVERSAGLTVGAGERKAETVNGEGKEHKFEQTDAPVVVDGKGQTTM